MERKQKAADPYEDISRHEQYITPRKTPLTNCRGHFQDDCLSSQRCLHQTDQDLRRYEFLPTESFEAEHILRKQPRAGDG